MTTGAYTEYEPGPGSARAVRCTWSQVVTGPLEQQHVMPDGCVDLVVFPDGRISIAGPDTGPLIAELANGCIVGLRFHIGAAGDALGLPASELRDQRVLLSDVWGDAARVLTEQLAQATSLEARRAALEAAVSSRHARSGDPLVMEAARRLKLGTCAVSDLSHDLGVSDRHLLRRFDTAIGYGPKTLDRVLRFRRLLDALRAHEDPELAALAHDAGYADQAHMTRECRRLAGVTPVALYARLG